MDTFFILILFFLSVVVIFKGGEMLVESAIFISNKLKISPIIVGSTIVSLATTLPETCISLIAVKKGEFAFATGNVLGSMICNFALILGIAFSFMPARFNRVGFASKCSVLFVDLLLLVVFSINGSFSVVEGCFLLVVFLIFILLNIFESLKKKDYFISTQEFQFFEYENGFAMFLQFVVGAFAIAFGSHILVENSISIGGILGFGPKFTVITLVALVTGLPEIVTTISSIRHKNSSIGVGNMIGANIINGAFLMGICCIFAKGKLVIDGGAFIAFLILLVSYMVAIIPTVLRQKTSRVQGFLLLLIYLCYCIYLYFM